LPLVQKGHQLFSPTLPGRNWPKVLYLGGCSCFEAQW
jgi:hypothetical protein